MDTVGVVAIVPLMQYLTGISRNSGALGVVERILGHPNDKVLVGAIAGTIILTFLVKDILAIFVRRWQLRMMARQEISVSSRLLEGYLVGPYAWQLAKNTGDKLWTVDHAVAIGFSGGFSAALGAMTEVFTITLIFGALVVVSPTVTLAAVAYLGTASFLVFRVIRLRVAAAGERSVAAAREQSMSLLQAFGAVKEIKLRRAEKSFVTRYETARRQGAEAGATGALLNELPKYLLEIVFIVGVGLLSIGLELAHTSQHGLVLLGLFLAAGTRVLPSAVRLMSSLNGIRFSRAPLAHLVQENRMHDAARLENGSSVVTQRIPHGDLVCRDVSFAYESRPSHLVLRDVELTIQQGRTFAVVGSSGAGKSTLVDCLLGLHHPAGEIMAGGISIFDNLPGWQQQLAVVPQEVYLLDDSLTRNIAFTDEVDDDRMQEVVERAQLSDLVESLPDGLHTEVGERGARLSGGQRQRIGIARALYRRPKYLFLDEATSALDNETERRLAETIAGLGGSMTIVIVAHRLSTVRHSDQLVFMSGGRVVSIGTFDEVAAQNAEFAHLVRLGSLAGPSGA